MPSKFFIIITIFIASKLCYANDDNIFAVDDNEYNSNSEYSQKDSRFNNDKDLSHNNTVDYSNIANRAAAYEDEFKQAIGRIEKLEHDLILVKSQLVEIKNTNISDNLAVIKKDNIKDNIDKQANDIKTDNLKPSNNSNKIIQTVDNAEKDEYDKALQLYRQSKYIEAEQKFNNFIRKFSSSKLNSNCLFWLGEISTKKKMHDKAAINYLKSYKNLPRGDKASDALLKLSFSLGELKKFKEACSTLKKLENEFPNRSAASKKIAKDYQVKFQCSQN